MLVPHLLGAVAAPAAPAAVALPILAGLTLAAFLGWALARGLLAAWTHTIGYLLQWLASELKFSIHTIVGTVSLDIGGPFRAADHAVIKALQAWVDGMDSLMGKFWHAMASVAEWTVAEFEAFADATVQGFTWLERVHLPKWAKAALIAAFPEAYIARLVIDAVRKYALHPGKVVQIIEHTVTHTVVKTIHAAGAIALPTPWAFPRFRRWERDIAAWRHVTGKRLARLEALLAASGLALAVAKMLGLPNWRCLTKGPIGKVSRALCGMSGAALNDLLGLLADVVILTDICRVITLLEDGLGLIEPALTEFISGASAIACYGDSEAPPVLTGPALSLPPVTGIALSLG